MSLPAAMTVADVADDREQTEALGARLIELAQERVRVSAAIQSLRAAQGALRLDLGERHGSSRLTTGHRVRWANSWAACCCAPAEQRHRRRPRTRLTRGGGSHRSGRYSHQPRRHRPADRRQDNTMNDTDSTHRRTVTPLLVDGHTLTLGDVAESRATKPHDRCQCRTTPCGA